MSKKRRNSDFEVCVDCGEFFEITADVVKRRKIIRGYDVEYFEYFIECPNCKEEARKIEPSKHSLKLAFQVWRKFRKEEKD